MCFLHDNFLLDSKKKKNQNGYFRSNPFNLLVISSLVKSSILTEKYEENVEMLCSLYKQLRGRGEKMTFLKLKKKHEEKNFKQ